MLDRYTAQGLVDGMAALALAAATPQLARQGPGGPLGVRLGFVVGGLCLFFATRSAFEALRWPALGEVVLLIVCVLPLAALVLAEGVLRRHAPSAMKALVTAGGALMAIAIVATGGAEPASSAGLGGFVLASLAAVTALLLLRDRTSLSPQENLGVDALLAVSVLLVLLTVSDFLPTAPIGLSGVGAATLAFVLEGAPNSRREGRRLAAELGVMALLATAGALVFAGPLAMGGAVQTFRLAVLLLAMLLAASAVAGALRRRENRTLLDFAAALARADTASLDGFMQTLADQPLLAGLRLVEGPGLADYDAEGLAAAMAGRVIWTRKALDEDVATPQRNREELADLMSRLEATHAMMLSPTPLRIALLALPELGPAEGIEVHLALFRKLAAQAAGNAP